MIINLKTFEMITEKTGDETYDYGCLMASFNIDSLEKININENDLTGDGLEPYSHVTVLYGFLDDKIVVQDVLDKVTETQGPIEINVTGISIFENSEFDVVKYEIESAQLAEMNKYFSANFENENKFPDYKAHMTIAYVKCGEGKKYVKTFDEPIKLYTTDFIYSMICGQKLKVKCIDMPLMDKYTVNNPMALGARKPINPSDKSINWYGTKEREKNRPEVQGLVL